MRECDNGEDYLLSEEACRAAVAAASEGRVSCLGDGEAIAGSLPPWSEERVASHDRMTSAALSLKRDFEQRGDGEGEGGALLIVTHGDLLHAVAQHLLGETTIVYEVNFCGMLIFNSEDELLAHHDVEILRL